jgi:hypothetical protein
VEDTTGKGARGPLPAEALEVERLVGLFDTERASGAIPNAAEFNEFSPRPLSDADLGNIRTLRAALFEQWRAVAPGQSLQLTFAPSTRGCTI